MFSIGDTIGGYVIRRELGTGGMGAVYLGEHRHIERKAAIKVLLPALSSRQDVVARFFAEARATSRICHPGIVEVLDCDVHASGRAYIVMEYLEGATLRAAIERSDGGLDLITALRITAEMADALAAAHDKGIVHRDLKPDNIFLASAGPNVPPTVKILDFGVAKLVESGDVSTTKTGSLLGTPLYMSPEQCRSASLAETRSDIYSLGCIVFEMLAGRPPFVSDGIGELFMAHMTERAPDLGAAARMYVPPGVCALVARMLEKLPAARPDSMREVATVVASVAAELGGVPLRLPYTLVMDASTSSTAAPVPASGHRSRAYSAPVVGGTRALPPEKPAPPSSEQDARHASVTTLSRFATELEAAGVRRRPRALTFAAVLAGLGLCTLAAVKLLGSGGAGVAASAGPPAASPAVGQPPAGRSAEAAPPAPVAVVPATAPAAASSPTAPAAPPDVGPPSPVHEVLVLPASEVAAAPANGGEERPEPRRPETTPDDASHHRSSHHAHSHSRDARTEGSSGSNAPSRSRTVATPLPARPAKTTYRALDDD